jgi:multiple sugar transport system permease protein
VRFGGERQRIDWIGYVFVATFALPFLLFNLLPVFFGAYVAFTEWNIFGPPEWVGTQNFTDAWNDEWVWIAFQNVFVYALTIVPSVTILALFFALYVNRGYPLAGLARTLFFSPNVVSATVIGLVWVWILDTNYGLINHYLGYAGIGPISWLTSTTWSKFGVSIASVWWDLGLAFVLILAALQDIPRDLLEAARVDGAGPFNRLRFVILPNLRPVLSMVVTLQLIATLRIFSQIYVMTNGAPAGSSSSPILYIYQTAITRNLYGYASALSVVLFVVILAITLMQRTIFREVRQ